VDWLAPARRAASAAACQEPERNFFADQGLEFETDGSWQAVDLEAEEFGDAFAAGEPLDDQRGQGETGGNNGCRNRCVQSKVLDGGRLIR
jgi:hypothetical protein